MFSILNYFYFSNNESNSEVESNSDIDQVVKVNLINEHNIYIQDTCILKLKLIYFKIFNVNFTA
jgi:hypothetical protein